MEMTREPSAQRRPGGPPPAPFSSGVEREELERALLPPPAAATTAAFMPTAVPIATAVPVMAVATYADLPPPPPAVAASTTIQAERAHEKAAKKKAAYAPEKSDFSVEDGVIVRPEPPSYGDGAASPLPTAPALPTHADHLPSAEHRRTAAQLRAANVIGGISSEEEDAATARGERRMEEERRRTAEGVREANAAAARKAHTWDEGLAVDEGIHRLNLKSDDGRGAQGEGDDARPYGITQPDGKRGYEVAEYDVVEYDTKDYDVAEYKSVYD